MCDDRELLIELRTGKTRPVGKQPPILTSAQAPWRGIRLEHHRFSPFETNDACCLNNVVFLQLQTAITLEWKENGEFRSGRILPGHSTLAPAQTTFSVRSRDSGQCLSVSLDSKFLAWAACEFDGADGFELIPFHGLDDPLVHAICMAMKTEVENGVRGGRLYGESLGTALAVHLVQNYSGKGPRAREYRGGLAKYQLRRALDYIHEHLAEDITLESLASLAGISAYHFARMFKQSIGLAPHQYLVKCRVERAKELLVRSDAAIADIAAQLGFCDQSHLAFHFKRMYGATPKKFLREAITRKSLV